MPNKPSDLGNAGYLVPCLLKAMQMIDVLRETRAGMRVEDFRELTKYSRSTIYRILRTLIAFEYVVRDPRRILPPEQCCDQHYRRQCLDARSPQAWSTACYSEPQRA
jgi:IclR helix-turn-helix domain